MEGFLKYLLPVAIGGLGVPMLLWAWQRFLPRPKTYMFAFKIGRLVANWGNVKMGKEAFSKASNMGVTTLFDLADGIRDGLRVDTNPEPTPPLTTELPNP